jgi:SAM-dependent methyltransferase
MTNPSGPGDVRLSDMDPTGRFTDRAADYVRYRPSYPAAAFDAMLEGLGERSRIRAADVGAGTGISSRLLADRVAHVTAIEPNAAMREAAAPHPRVEWREGAGEATGLADASVDLVLAAQAFHWFRHDEAIVEFHRVLRPGGRLALLWNGRDRGDPLTAGYIEAIHAVNGEHPAERRELDSGVIEGSGRFTAPVVLTFPFEQALDRAGLIGRATSASYVPREGAAFAELRRLLIALYERHRDEWGIVRLRYVTRVHLAERL